MACKPQYKGKRYNSLEELYKANGVNPQQKQEAQQLYSQYLDTIFPDSKVKDIVYHETSKYSKEKILEQEFNAPIEEQLEFGKDSLIWFSGKKNYYGTKNTVSIPAVLNSISPRIDSHQNFEMVGDASGIRNYYLEAVGSDALITEQYADEDLPPLRDLPEDFVNPIVFAAVIEPEQIHILGSKQDIEGFKEFIKKQEEIQKESPISQRIDKTFISTEELIFSLNNKEFFKDFIKNNNIKTEITKDEALINNKGESLNAYYNTDKNQIVLSKNATEKDLYTAILEYYLLENTDEEINNLLYDLYTEIIDSENYNISSEVDFVNKLFTSSRIKEDLKTVDSKSEEYKSLFDEFLSVISNKNSISAQEIEELLIKPSIVISQDTMSIEKMPDITSMRVLRKIESC